MSEPIAVVAGDSITWKRGGGDYPSDQGWTLTYYLTSPQAALAPLVAAADGAGGYVVTVTPAESSLWAPSLYDWQARVGDGTDVHTVATGEMVVATSLATLDRHDGRAWAEKALEAIEAVLINKASVDQQSYSIGGRSVSRYTTDELMQMRHRLQSEVTKIQTAERIARGTGMGNTIRVRL